MAEVEDSAEETQSEALDEVVTRDIDNFMKTMGMNGRSSQSKALAAPVEEDADDEQGSSEGESDSKEEDDDKEDEGDSSEAEEELSDKLTPREKILLARLNELEKTRRPQEETAPEIPPLVVADDEVDFMEDIDDLDDLLGDPKKFNKLLNKVRNDAKAQAAKITAEHILSSLPATISFYAKKQMDLYGAISDFYRENKDLNNETAKSFLGSEAMKIAEAEPGISITDLMERSAKRVRKLLATQGKGGQTKPTLVKDKNSPAFAGQRSARSREKDSGLTELEKEMFALIPK